VEGPAAGAASPSAPRRCGRVRGASRFSRSSNDLGRNLEENISVHSDGIRDFGEGKALSAIDLMIRLGRAADAVQAAHWLCERLGIKPENLSWRDLGGETENIRSTLR